MRRTDDGFDPLEIAGNGKKFARPTIPVVPHKAVAEVSKIGNL